MSWHAIEIRRRIPHDAVKSKQNCAPPKASRPSASITRPATTLPAISPSRISAFAAHTTRPLAYSARGILPALFLFSAFCFSAASAAVAQDNPLALPNSGPPPPTQNIDQHAGTIKVDVIL